ncbi:MAG: adenosylcobinamide-phosphate synthase CbiB [Dehalococcoidia bacterium]
MSHEAWHRSEPATVLMLAVGLDLIFSEPPARLHPVVGIGELISFLERVAPKESQQLLSFLYGTGATAAIVGATALLAAAADGHAGSLPKLPRLVLKAVVLKPAFSLRLLLESGSTVRRALERGDRPDARLALRSLVSRSTTSLSSDECAAAAIESLAENTTDSVIGPWLFYAFGGLPAVWLFRAANTLDSRWGYHGRYEWLGRSAAKLDDLLAFVPARLSAFLLIAASPLGPGSPATAWRALRRDRARTESPNAGWTMSAMAGALDRRLEKPGHYRLNSLGSGPTHDDIRRAQRITIAAAVLGLALSAGLSRRILRSSRGGRACGA